MPACVDSMSLPSASHDVLPLKRLRAAQVRQAAGLIEEILRTHKPADRVLEQHFRAHRNMGANDRRNVAELVYGVLREYRLFSHLSGSEQILPALCMYLRFRQHWTSAQLAEAGLPAVQSSADELPFAIRYSLPDWLAERLLDEHGPEQAAALAQSLLQSAPLDLRVNTLKTSRDALAQALAEQGYPAQATSFSPLGLRRHERSPLFKLSSFQDGWFEVQDEGSQLLAYLVDPRPGQRVVDLCAGAGGKSLALAAMMENRGEIWACDVAPRRLQELRRRMRRAGAHNIRVQPIADVQDASLAPLLGRCQRVLLDVPCSGTGTLRRNPDLKWRPPDLLRLQWTQAQILAAGARLVQPGGRLIYATCSLLRAENQAIVEEFLGTHPQFKRLNPADILARRGIVLDAADGEGNFQLLPHRHGTDGFFACVLEWPHADAATPVS